MRFYQEAETSIADVMILRPEIVFWLAVMFSFVVAFWLYAKSKPAVILQQPALHCSTCRCKEKPTAKLRKRLKGFGVVSLAVMSAACGSTAGLQSSPRIALFSFKPVTVMFRTGLLAENLRCARVEWDFGDGCRSVRDSDVCSDRMSITHRYVRPGIYETTARFVTSIGDDVILRGHTDLVDSNRQTGMERALPGGSN